MDLSVSQNFVTNKDLISKLVRDSKITKEDTVFDVGAGTGIISSELARVAKKVYAVEVDKKLEFSLKTALKEFQNVEILIADFLKLPLPENTPYKVFSNIPFSITSDIINKLVFADNPPEESFLFVQKEAAYRFLGKGEGFMISQLIKPFFDLKIIYEFNKNDFNPKPSVNIVLLQIKKLEKPLVNEQKMQEYRNFVTYTLEQQKPTLKLRLNRIFTSQQFYRLSKDLLFSPEAQATELNTKQWVGLFEYYLIGVTPEKKKIVSESLKKRNISGPTRSKIRLHKHTP